MSSFRTAFLLLGLGLSLTALAGPPPRPEGPPPAGREGRDHRLGEVETRILLRVKEMAPDRYDQLIRLRDEHPVAYRKLMFANAPMLKHADEDPASADRFFEMVDLTEELSGYLDGWSALSAGEQKKRHAEIEQVVGQMFEVRQAERQSRLADMERRIAELKQEIQQRAAEKDQVVKDFTDDILSAVNDQQKGEKGGL